jgi:alkanesulfonate monooxygenase SsuD/methylene tetrahydromethanopterin reductase-like flavin-dependent oxidoreductase (luciferase family)
MRALRRDRVETEDDFPREVAELQRLLGPIRSRPAVIAMPGAGTRVPIWLLGSSLFSAQLAAERGLPYAFASHFAPRLLHQAIDLYRGASGPRRSAGRALRDDRRAGDRRTRPTRKPSFLASSVFQRVLGILHGDRRCLPPPVADFMAGLHPQERAGIADFLGAAVIGGPDTRARRIRRAAAADAGRRVHPGLRYFRSRAAPAFAGHRRRGVA